MRTCDGSEHEACKVGVGWLCEVEMDKFGAVFPILLTENDFWWVLYTELCPELFTEVFTGQNDVREQVIC